MLRAAGALLVGAVAACSALEPALGPEETAAETAASDGGGADAGGDAALVSFARDIRPLMNRSNVDGTGHGCMECHYPGEGTEEGLKQVGLDLSTLGTLRKGGSTSGATIIDTANPETSALVEKLRGRYFSGVRMPKDGPPYWSDDEIALVVTWMRQGAMGAASE